MTLSGRRILVTSGPTRAPLDAVRFLTNKSTGRLGALIAEAAVQAGADVTFVYGRGSDTPAVRGGHQDHLRLLSVDTVDDLIAVFKKELPTGYDAVVHAMAVLDFEPAEVREEKTSSDLSEWVVRLTPTPKASRLVKTLAPKTCFVGFKLEVGKERDELLEISSAWAAKNGADLVVANDLRDIEGGLHIGYLIRNGMVEAIAEGKEAIARVVVDFLGRSLKDR
ncbi:MAG TPA: phosphopantothenoylcysteine decarboxylase [bacterium]|nr:phosphopantothenoylcysteine decarboxylase [bacterium]